MLRAGFDAVRDVRLPAAGLVHVSYQGFVHEWDHQAMSTAVAAMLEPCTAVIAAHPARLDSPCPMPPGHAYVGPIADPAPGTLDPQLASTLATPGDPWLLVSLSTTTQCGQRAALARILGAVARLPVRALVTLGGAVTASDLDLPPNAVATRYIPHELALPHMSAVVSHAGMSTISTALAAGVPLICVPLGRDSQATRAASPQREPASPSARPQASASSPTPSPRSSAIPPMPARHEPSQPNSGPSAAASTPPASSRPSRHSKSQDHPVPPMGPAIGLACGCGATALLSLVPGTWKPNIPASAATAKDQDLHDHHAGAGPTPGSRAQRRRSARHRDSRP